MSPGLRRAGISFVCAAVFAAGLTLTGAMRPATIYNAFDFSRSWDPRIYVMFAAALLVHAPIVAWLRGRDAVRIPQVPARIDAPLVFGSLLFGTGWGLAGICPGPALTSALTGSPHTTTFIVGLAAGLVLHHLVYERSRSTASAPSNQTTE